MSAPEIITIPNLASTPAVNVTNTSLPKNTMVYVIVILLIVVIIAIILGYILYKNRSKQNKAWYCTQSGTAKCEQRIAKPGEDAGYPTEQSCESSNTCALPSGSYYYCSTPQSGTCTIQTSLPYENANPYATYSQCMTSAQCSIAPPLGQGKWYCNNDVQKDGKCGYYTSPPVEGVEGYDTQSLCQSYCQGGPSEGWYCFNNGSVRDCQYTDTQLYPNTTPFSTYSPCILSTQCGGTSGRLFYCNPNKKFCTDSQQPFQSGQQGYTNIDQCNSQCQ